MTEWYLAKPDEVISELGSRRAGLSEREAEERLQRYGANELKGKKKSPPLFVFLRQFLSPLIYVLLAAVVVSILVGHYLDAWVVLGVLVANATIGFLQETRAEKAMEALLRMAAPKAKVRRDGAVKQLLSRQIVPGDMFLLESGDMVPADARLIETSNLKTNEAALTGESMPVDKHTTSLSGNVSVADRKNMVFMGTIVTYGRANAIAVSTGMSTEIGKIAGAIGEIKPEKTPLQKSISKLSQYILAFVLAIVAILILVGLVRGLGWLDIFLLAVAASVSAIPEGLPAVVTVVLASGMQIMARRNAIIRKLAAVETLGSATVICSDKTGTLTLNQMTVRSMFVAGSVFEVTGKGYDPHGEFRSHDSVFDPADSDALRLHLRIGALCNDALLTCEEDFCSIYGDPTEGALVVVAAKAGIEKEKAEMESPRLDEIPFQSERLYMATMHPGKDGGRVVYVKGAVEKVLSFSGYLATDSGYRPLEQEDTEAIVNMNDDMASQAMRVIATAYAELPPQTEGLEEERFRGRLIFVGLTGMADPPRQEAKEAVRQCHRAGIKVVMITGDNRVTAESVARQLELGSGKVLTGPELQAMTDEELVRGIEGISVFARIEPLHKLRIVDAFKSRGHVVAMTGDGVNDAPALKSASIGIAMGITGTDVAKEAADMVLADDNFASVVSAVDEGRAIFNRLRNVVFFLLSTNFGELLALILSVSVLGLAPLLPLQIIWVNLVTDTAAGIPLGLEPKSGKELLQPPRHPKVGLIFPGLLLRVAFMAAIMSAGIFLVFDWAQARMDLAEARTIAFCTMVTFEWFRSFNARSDELTLLKLGFFTNRWLALSISLAILLQLAVVYLPFMQVAFDTVPIGIDRWGIVVLAGGSLFIIEELRKTFFPRLFSIGKWRPVR